MTGSGAGMATMVTTQIRDKTGAGPVISRPHNRIAKTTPCTVAGALFPLRFLIYRNPFDPSGKTGA